MGILENKERISVTGKIKVDVFRAGYADAVQPYLDQLKALRNGTAFAPMEYVHATRDVLETIDKIKTAYFIRTAVECPNTVMDSPNYGIDLLIQWLSGVGTYASTVLPLSYIEIGTGSTTPTITDTALTTPTNRAAVGFQQDYGTTDAIVQAIFSDSQLTNGTYYEMGTFCGGTSSIGSGQMFNHALFGSPYTKASGTDTSINTDINFS
jgi:hypothetical protein